jgi:hypothetical protein
MYLGKDATTEGNLELGKVSDVAISNVGEIYYLVEKGKLQKRGTISPKKMCCRPMPEL